ncbi:MAG: type I methionyl aminopeptidase [Cyclobacteriaceae bacterium]|nr:type I methionyl aminopeptidase [Cyclobacteriaceae bacterium]
MIKLKSKEEIELMRQSAQLVSKTLGMLASEIRPGVTTLYLDNLAEIYIRDHQAVPGFLGLYNFPNTLCMSLNEQVVHGIPNNKPLVDGDIISIDCGVLRNGYYGDHAYTFTVGEIVPEVQQLLDVTKKSLYLGIEQMVAGNRIGDISFAIQRYTEKHGYGVVRELVGHGLGKKMHESPEVPNYGKRGRGSIIKNGLVLAIEPMINLGTRKVKQLSDGWTIVTSDGKPSAHFEHNVAVINGRPEILSTFDYIEEELVKVNS